RDGHVRHDIVVAAPSQPRQKCAGSLNSVLRISGETNYGVLNIFRPQIGAVRSRTGIRSRSGSGSRTGGRSAIALRHNGSFIHGIITVTELEQHSTGN